MNFLIPKLIPDQDIIFNPDPIVFGYLKEIIPHIRKKCSEYSIGFECMFESCLNNYKGSHPDSDMKTAIHSGKRYGNPGLGCMYPWKRMHIEPDGKIKPSSECNLMIGDLNNDTLENIWNSHGMRLYRKSVSTEQTKEICSEQCAVYNLDRKFTDISQDYV